MQFQGKRVLRKGLVVFGFFLAVSLAFTAGLVAAKPSGPFAAVASGLGNASGTLASVLNIYSEPPDDVKLPADFKQFWELWRNLKENYYEQPVDEEKMFYGAMSGLASSLGDPYTVFFDPKIAKEFNESLAGKFEGIGAEIGIKNDQLQIIAPLPEMPAEKAGLRAGDFILKIDETDTVGMSVEKAVSLIRGPKGTEVALTIGRYKTETDKDGKESKTPETLEVKITRSTIIIKSVRSKYLEEHKLAHIEISNFNQDTAQEFSKAVNDALNREVKGIILDLRNDPGGYLDRAISIAGEWTGSMVVVKERRQGKIVDEFHGTASGRLKNFPTVVLVNEGSASASEIVAGALQDYQLAKIVGMTTFGKGSVQDYQEFPDKSSIKMTIAEWVTPLERSIDKKGIVPDIEIERTAEDYNANRDPQLDKAIELLTGKPVPEPAASAKTPPAAAE
jgi:carboxyl-terminal processing protease